LLNILSPESKKGVLQIIAVFNGLDFVARLGDLVEGFSLGQEGQDVQYIFLGISGNDNDKIAIKSIQVQNIL